MINYVCNGSAGVRGRGGGGQVLAWKDRGCQDLKGLDDVDMSKRHDKTISQ